MTTKETAKAEATLVGRFFVTAAQDGKIGNQGRINEQLPNDRYIISVFSWLTGDETAQLVVTGDDICKYFTLSGKSENAHVDFCKYYNRENNRKVPTQPYKIGVGPLPSSKEVSFDVGSLRDASVDTRTNAAKVFLQAAFQKLFSAMPKEDDSVCPRCDVAYAAFLALLDLEEVKHRGSWQSFLQEALNESINQFNESK